MFDPDKPRIPYKRHVWDMVTTGHVMVNALDTETSGVGPKGDHYTTPNTPFLTEYADARGDIGGNLHDNAQIYLQRPATDMFEAGAPIKQRIKDGPELFDNPERTPCWQGTSQTIWRLERARIPDAHPCGQYQSVQLRDINKQFKHGQKKASEDAIAIPLRDDDGQHVYDVRWHPDRQLWAYRVDDDPKSQYRESLDNQYYIDEETGARWKWVEPNLNILTYNGPSYDIPIMRANFYAMGMPIGDTTFMYTRARPTNKQIPKPRLIDVQHMARLVALYGPQDSNGLKLDEIIDLETGQVRSSEALSNYLEANTGYAVPQDYIHNGPFMPDSGDKHDTALDHGALYDSLGTLALWNLCWDIAPEICSTYVKQCYDKGLNDYLERRTTPDNANTHFADDQWRLFALPVRRGADKPYDQPFYFIGDDSQIGDFKRKFFMKCDGTLHEAAFKGKYLKDLSADEWYDYIMSRDVGGDPDRHVRSVSQRNWPGVLHVDEVMRYTAQAARWRDNTTAMKRDVAYIVENPAMINALMQAQERVNTAFRHDRHHPADELPEDEMMREFRGDVPYLFTKSQYRDYRQNGPEQVPDIAKTVKAKMDNELKMLREIRDSMKALFVQPHAIDCFADYPYDNHIHAEDEEAARILENFKDLCQRLYSTRIRKKNWAYKGILDEMINPATNEPFFKKNGELRVTTVREAAELRRMLGQRVAKDYDIALRNTKSHFAQGYDTKDTDKHTYRGRHLFLFPDPDNGWTGNTPKIVDEGGGEIDLDYLYAQHDRDVQNKLNSGNWGVRFYRLGSEPTMTFLAKRFAELGRFEKLPGTVQALYYSYKDKKLDGFPDATATTDRTPTRRSVEHHLKHDKSLKNMANENEEGHRLLQHIHDWLKRSYKQDPPRKQLADLAYDPDSGEMLDPIDYEIPRDEAKDFPEDPNFVVVEAPLAHVYNPIRQMDPDYRPNGLILSGINRQTRDKIKRGKPLIVRTSEGLIFHAAKATIQKAPDLDSKRYRTMMEKAETDYREAGRTLSDKDRLYYLGFESLNPVANTRDIDFSHQTFVLPFNHFYATVAPEFARAARPDQPLTAAILPLDYCPQAIYPGKSANLFEGTGAMFSNIDGASGETTGHMFETRLADALGLDEDGKKTGLRLGDLVDHIRSGDIPPEIVERAGFLGLEHLEQRLLEWTSHKGRNNPRDQRVLVMAFDRVNKDYFDSGRDEQCNKWAAFYPDMPPRSAFIRAGTFIPPSAYRPASQMSKLEAA